MGTFKRRIFLSKGALTIATGLVLAVVAFLSGPVSQTLWAHLAVAETAPVSMGPLVLDYHWVLSRAAFALIVAGMVMVILDRRSIESDLHAKNALLDDLKASKYTVDQQFRYLFDTTSDLVFCYEHEQPLSISCSVEEHIEASYSARLIHANDVFVKELRAKKLTDVLGQRFGDLEFAGDPEAYRGFIAKFVDRGYFLTGNELIYTTPSGKNRAYRTNLIGVVKNDMLERIWGIGTNVIEFRETRAELTHRQRFEKLVADISSRLVVASDAEADDVIRECLGDAARFIGAERASIFWPPDRAGKYVAFEYVWTTASDEPIGPGVSTAKFPAFWKLLQDRRIVRVDDAALLSEDFAVDRLLLDRLNLKALLLVPLIVEGELVGGVSYGRIECTQAWTDQIVADVAVFSDLLSNFVLRLKSRRELAAALTRLQDATNRLEAENVYLRGEVELTHGFDEIIGESPAILRCLKLVENVAVTETPVLILGETGTGKELIARAIHDHSDRRDRPLVKVNCAALPASLIESELFGHEKGAFTGADSRKRGRFDLAHGSTLFLDEIGEMPIELQAKLLRVLQDGEFERLGGTRTIKVDVRIIVATNRNIDKAVRDGEFRSDLYYRINTFPIELPALRERGDDVEILARHFVNLHAQRLSRDVQEISAEMMRQLRAYRWPGNVRELDGIIQRALISSSGPVANLAEPLVDLDSGNDGQRIISSTIVDLKLVERDHIVTVLDSTRWRISGDTGAAAQLGIPPSTLRSKMKKLGINRPH